MKIHTATKRIRNAKRNFSDFRHLPLGIKKSAKKQAKKALRQAQKAFINEGLNS